MIPNRFSEAEAPVVQVANHADARWKPLADAWMDVDRFHWSHSDPAALIALPQLPKYPYAAFTSEWSTVDTVRRLALLSSDDFWLSSERVKHINVSTT